MELDRILNHAARPIIYFAHKSGSSIDELAVLYRTTPRVIRLTLRRYHRRLVKMQFEKDPA